MRTVAKVAASVALTLALCSSAMAFNVTPAVDGSFSLMGPVDNFTNWAVAGGAINNGFETFKTALSADQWMTGTQSTETWANIQIPFVFTEPIKTARFDYAAVCVSMGNNWGRVLLDITTDGGANYTNIFTGNSDAGEPAFNYTTSQTPPDPMNWWRGYTDITNLVNGQMGFELRITVLTSWTSWSYNGGAFLPSGAAEDPLFADPNFYFTGSVYPDGGISGNIIPMDYGKDLAGITVKMDITKDDAFIGSKWVQLDSAGNFTLPGLKDGVYNITMKANCWLSKTVGPVTIANKAQVNIGTVSLPGGDLDGDNEVTSTDLSILGLNLGMTGE